MNQQILPCWLAGSQFLKIKFYWNTATLIYLHIVYGCFCITTAELSSYDRECMVCKAKNIYYLVLYRKNSPTPALGETTTYRQQLYLFKAEFNSYVLLCFISEETDPQRVSISMKIM